MFGSLNTFPHFEDLSQAELRPISRLSTGFRGNVSTPLESYIYARQHPTTWKRRNYTSKLPLSSLASGPVAELGQTGGSFNASGVLQEVPLSSLYHPSSGLQRGKRNVPIRTERYLPAPYEYRVPTSSRGRGAAEGVEPWQMSSRLSNSWYSLQQSRSRIASRSARHREEQNFFLNGSSANFHKRGMFSQDIIDKQLKYYTNAASFSTPPSAPMQSPKENSSLYYGKVSSLSHQKPQTKALKHLREIIEVQNACHIREEFPIHSSDNKSRQNEQYLNRSSTVFITQGDQ